MKKEEASASGRWVGYRPGIKIVDCTIRDGGLMNNHKFEPEVVKAVYQACVDGGIDYMEIGYKGDRNVFTASEFGLWKSCSEEDIRQILGDNDTNLKLSVMADVGRTDYHNDILPCKDSIIDMIRVAAYIHQIPAAIDMIKDAHDKGYETTINLMSVSTCPEAEIDEALELLAGSEVDIIYLVDSFGALYSEQTRGYMDKYKKYTAGSGKSIGMHAHNNQQLAYANTIEALIMGADYLDGSLAGLGRGAGNCATEQLMGFLHNPKYNIRPLLQCIEQHVEPLRSTLLWGPDIPYMLTGLMNQHPRAAIKFNATADRGKIVKFYDTLIEEE